MEFYCFVWKQSVKWRRFSYNKKKEKKRRGFSKVSMSTGIVSRGTEEYDRLNPSDYYEAFGKLRRNAAAVPGIASPAALGRSLSATNNIVGTNLFYNHLMFQTIRL
jgi:hypothetical protein